MFEWLKELAQKLWEYLRFWYTIYEYERGVLLRLGRRHGGVRTPGFYFKLPFFDDVLSTQVVPTTLDLSEQTITTKDGTQLVVESTVKYEVEDAVKLLLEVRSAADALADMAKGIIRREAVQSEWPDTNSDEFERVINRKIKLEAKKWGLKVHEVSITSMAPMLSIRLLQTSSWKDTDRVKE
ncbi:MAG TPA: SPFH domain-containing protein [Chitinophagaceae bacterium]